MQLIVNGFSSEKKTIAGFGCSQGPARKASLSLRIVKSVYAKMYKHSVPIIKLCLLRLRRLR